MQHGPTLRIELPFVKLEYIKHAVNAGNNIVDQRHVLENVAIKRAKFGDSLGYMK